MAKNELHNSLENLDFSAIVMQSSNTFVRECKLIYI